MVLPKEEIEKACNSLESLTYFNEFHVRLTWSSTKVVIYRLITNSHVPNIRIGIDMKMTIV